MCYFREKEPGSLKNMPFLRYASELDIESYSRLVAFPSREYPGLVKVKQSMRRITCKGTEHLW